MTEKHLWEYDHPYYCEEQNYFARPDDGVFSQYESWAEYIDDNSWMDKSLNLLFRWDWDRIPPEDLQDYEADDYTGDTLKLYFMAQRKGRYFSMFVKVGEVDEDAVRMYLREYADHMRRVWEPLLNEERE